MFYQEDEDIDLGSDVEAALSGLKIEIFIKDPKCVNKLEYNGKAKIPGDMSDCGAGILC